MIETTPSPNKPFRLLERHDFWLLGLWALVNLIQAGFTELFHDEAYYWTWSLSPAWGYAEHPPMIAWWIWVGTQVTPHEWGVRLLPVLFGTGTIYLILRLLPPLSFSSKALMLSGVVGLQVLGFLAVPDSPYVFFITLFLYQYRLFLQGPSWYRSAIMGILIALVLYSKYHGMMVFGMVLLSHPRLLKSPKFWFSIGLSLALLSPLIIWLFDQEFATFRFHLGNRMLEDPDWFFVWNYFTGQIGITGPILGFCLLPAAFLVKSATQFERSLKFIFLGIFSFLFLMSFRAWVESNWSAGALIPMFILAGHQFQQQGTWRKWLYRLGWPSLGLMLLFRVYLAFNFLTPLTGGQTFKDEFHGWDQWAKVVQTYAGDRPVVFFNSYQYPSKYWYYTGEQAYTMRGFAYHPTQFDYLNQEQTLRGREVYLVNLAPEWNMKDTLPTQMVRRQFFGGALENFQSYQQIKIESPTDPLELISGDSLRAKLSLHNPYRDSVRFDANQAHRAFLVVHIHQDGRWRYYRYRVANLNNIPSGSTIPLQVVHQLKIDPGQ